MQPITTVYHSYLFDTRNPTDQTAYNDLKANLKGQGLTCFDTWGGSKHYNPKLDGVVLTLETAFLFENQWNTAPIEGFSETGIRVMDWAQDYPVDFDKHIKKGYYLDQTEAMREVRRNTVKCGYCGKNEPAQKGYVFCPHCLDSEYLKESELKLTRMMPIDDRSDRQELSQAERDHLLPSYRSAQLHGSTERGTARLAKQRQDIERKYQTETVNAKAERDGLIWLLDRGIKIDNVIYYNHKGMFSFGWRSPVSEGFKSELLDVLSEFPFEYEIKTADGVLSGRE